jgi:NADH:ubiquinone oxidoreductase subunit D
VFSLAEFQAYLDSNSGLHPLCHSTLDFSNLDISTQHRGDEKLLENRDYRQGLSLINRNNWLTPSAAEIAYAECAEDLLGITVSDRAKVLRELTLRLQIASGRLLHVIGVLQFLGADFSTQLAARETIVGLLEKITGVRMHSSQIRIGGVADDFDDYENAISLLRQLTIAEIDFSQLVDFGGLTTDVKNEWAITGIPSETHDAAVRMNFEVEKIRSSIEKAAAAIESLRALDGAINIQLPKVVRVTVGNVYKISESATGRVGVWLHSDGEKTPLRVGLRAPSAKNLQAIINLKGDVRESDFVAWLLTIPMCPGEISR